MVISREEILRLARLANIPLEEGEELSLSKELTKIVDYFDELNNINLKDAESSRNELKNVYRDDSLNSFTSLATHEALDQATKTHNDSFVVKAVINRNS